MGNRWGSEGPPLEAYSRVTDAERFRPLHPFALDLLADLERRYDVARAEGHELSADDRRPHLARATVRLSPASSDAAPLFLEFTTFPAVTARAGRWLSESFPGCGCDACDDTIEEAASELTWLVGCVTEGRFVEAIGWTRWRKGWLITELGPHHGRASRRGGMLERDRARAMLAGNAPRYDWRPWPARA